MTITHFLGNLNRLILNPLIELGFAIALLYFFFGIFQFIRSETADKGRKDGQKKIWYGLFGLFVMVSAYGLIHLILTTFGLPTPAYPAGL